MTFNLYNTPIRPIQLQLLALNTNGSTLMDISPYLTSASTSHTDQAESHRATFILNNAGGIFDPFSSGAYAGILSAGTILSYTITIGGTSYNRYYGEIVAADFNYERGKGEFVQISCLDPAFKLLTATVTSGVFTNQQINLIASDLILQYGGYTNTSFAPINLTVPSFQCPSLTVIDALSDLFGIPNYFFWWNYSGQFQTFPRVGAGIVGIPAATAPPTPDFILPDNALISASKPAIKTYDTINQVKVIGEALDASVQYGPIQLITSEGNANNYNFINPGGSKQYPAIPLTPGTSESNQQTVTGLYCKVYDPSFSNNVSGDVPGQDYKYLCADPTAISADTGLPVPLGPFQDDPNGSNPAIRSEKSNGRTEGFVYLNYSVNPGKSTWQTVNMSVVANSNGGGFLYYIEIWGKPIIIQDNAITVFLDYNPTTITNCACIDVFGDHKTYQVLDPANISTALSSNASAGSSSIVVTNSTGLITSASIIIGTGSSYETQQISSVVGTTVYLTGTLLNNHSSGEIVQTNTTIQPIGMSAPVEVLVSPTEPPNSTLANTAISGATSITLTSGAGFVTPQINPLSISTMNNIRIGNNIAVTTALTSPSSMGASTVTVGSTVGLAIGNEVAFNINGSPNYETNFITNISGGTLTLSTPLVYAHIVSEQVQTVPIYEYATLSAVSGNILTLDNPLVNSYNSGVVVQGLTAVITADGLFTSDLVRVDFEQGRLVFDDLTYNNFTEDNIATPSTPDTTQEANTPFGYTVTGGNAQNNVGRNNAAGTPYIPPTTMGVTNPAPSAVYGTSRQSANPTDGIGFTYVMNGFTPGRGYTLRLHFYEWFYVSIQQRMFNVYCNEEAILTNFDIFAEVGESFQLLIKEFEGINCDLSGNITLQFVNYSSGPNIGHSYPMVQCVEIVDPQGVGGALPEINCGGSAITPTPPTVTINGCYSQNQRQFGIRSTEIDNPLLSTEALCQQSGQYALNMAAWSNYPIEIESASFPTITPAKIIQFYNPFAGPHGCDQWMYVQAIDHESSRDRQKPVSQDTYKGFLLYSRARA